MANAAELDRGARVIDVRTPGEYFAAPPTVPDAELVPLADLPFHPPGPASGPCGCSVTTAAELATRWPGYATMASST